MARVVGSDELGFWALPSEVGAEAGHSAHLKLAHGSGPGTARRLSCYTAGLTHLAQKLGQKVTPVPTAPRACKGHQSQIGSQEPCLHKVCDLCRGALSRCTPTNP